MKRKKFLKSISLFMISFVLMTSMIMLIPQTKFESKAADPFESCVITQSGNTVTAKGSGSCTWELKMQVDITIDSSYNAAQIYKPGTSAGITAQVMSNYCAIVLKEKLQELYNNSSTKTQTLSALTSGSLNSINSYIGADNMYSFLSTNWSDFTSYVELFSNVGGPSGLSYEAVLRSNNNHITGSNMTSSGRNTFNTIFKFNILTYQSNTCLNYNQIFVPGFKYVVYSYDRTPYMNPDGTVNGQLLRDRVYNDIKSTGHNGIQTASSCNGVIYRGYAYSRSYSWAKGGYKNSFGSYPDETSYNAAFVTKASEKGVNLGTQNYSFTAGSYGDSIAYSGPINFATQYPTFTGVNQNWNTSGNLDVIVGTSSWLIFTGLLADSNPNPGYPTDCRLFDLDTANNNFSSTNLSDWGNGVTNHNGFPERLMWGEQTWGSWQTSPNGSLCKLYGMSHYFPSSTGENQYGVWVMGPGISSTGIQPDCYYDRSNIGKYGTNEWSDAYYTNDPAVAAAHPTWVKDPTGAYCHGIVTVCVDNKATYMKVPWIWEYPSDENTGSSSTGVIAYAEVVANEIGKRGMEGEVTATTPIDYEANTVKLAADWNVMEGIPSTENISIVSGGCSALFQIGGYTRYIGIYNSDKKEFCDEQGGTHANLIAVNNAGLPVNTANTAFVEGAHGMKLSSGSWNNLGVKRKIIIRSKLTNWWGTDNKPCTLSCPNGHEICRVSTSTDPGAPGSDLGEGADPNGTTDNEFVCDVCNGTFCYTWSGGEDEVPEETDDEGNVTQEHKDAVTGSWSGGHTCTAIVTFNCHSGSYTWSGAVESGDPEKRTLCSTNQHYISPENTWTCKGGATMSGKWDESTLIDNGYTYDTGCVCSNNHNLYHHQTKFAKFIIWECVDGYAYSQLQDYVIYGLTNNELIGVNPNLIDNAYATKKLSGSALDTRVEVVRVNADSGAGDGIAGGNTQAGDGHYESGNGRIWFTQNHFNYYDDITGCSGYQAGTTGATLLSEDCSKTLDYYHCFGNVVYDIGTFYVDHYAGQPGGVEVPGCGLTVNEEFVYNHASSLFTKNRGEETKLYAGGKGSSFGYTAPDECWGVTGDDGKTKIPTETWKTASSDGRNYTNGDVSSETELARQMLRIVNKWQYEQCHSGIGGGQGYSAIVFHDSISLGFQDTAYDRAQNLCGGVDLLDKGIPLYNAGFQHDVTESCGTDFAFVSQTDYDSYSSDTSSGTHYRYHHADSSIDDNLDDAHGHGADVGPWNRTITEGYTGDAIERVESRYKTPADWPTYSKDMPYACHEWSQTYSRDMIDFLVDSEEIGDGEVEVNELDFSVGDNSAVMGSAGVCRVNASKKTPFKNPISATDQTKTGYTIAYTQTKEISSASETFKGYWRDHLYPYKGKFEVHMWLDETGTPADKGAIATVTDNGNAALGTKYKNSDGSWSLMRTCLAISNIPLKWQAPNGVYNAPVTVNNHYEPFLNTINESTLTYDLKGDSTGVPNNGIYSSGPNNVEFSASLQKDYKCEYFDGYENTAGNTGEVNDIVIHDPVSNKYSIFIANNSGKYDPWVVDETNEDQRVDKKGIPEIAKPNYLVVGNSFHVWVTDYGDFRDTAGLNYDYQTMGIRGTSKSGDGWHKLNGTRNSESVLTGYTDSMNTGRWVKNRYIRFDFPVWFEHKNGTKYYCPAHTLVDLSQVLATTTEGGKGYFLADTDGTGALKTKDTTGADISNLFKTPSAGLTTYCNQHGDELRYGLEYEFHILTSSYESYDSKVEFITSSINEPNTTDVDEGPENLIRGNNYAAHHRVSNTDSTEVVGRIGNLALEDTADFRFSNLFKHALSTWLIPGVIYETDMYKPEYIVSTTLDILGDDANVTKHNTLSATAYLIGSPDSVEHFQHGKAGPWYPLPLSSVYNPVPEYQKQLMRLGYDSYFDIETIGNYYGMNADVTPTSITRYQGPSNAKESADRHYGPGGNGDAYWTKKMTIIPHYFLYDPADLGWYGINIYGGTDGNRSLVWSENDTITDPYELYIDLRSDETVGGELARRNATDAEEFLTEKIAKHYREVTEDFSVFEDSDYIGTSDKIELDYHDKSFIGTSYYDGAVYKPNGSDVLKDFQEGIFGYSMIGPNTDYSPNGMPTNGRIDPTAFTEQGQRWYFTLGLPSSSYITYSNTTLGKNQVAIEKSHKDLLKEHPNGVIVVFLDISVKGDVWELFYDARQQNADNNKTSLDYRKIKFEIPDLSNPDDLTLRKFTVTLPDAPVDVVGDGQPDIPPEWIPVIVYDKEWNSTYDLATYGTH